MKTNLICYKALLFSLPIAGIIFLSNCQNKIKDEEVETKADSVAISNPNQEELNSNQSELLTNVIGDSKEGVLRGVSFGTHLSKVKAIETYEMFEELPDHVGFTHETDQLESVDVLYVLSAEKEVKQIKVDVYLNSKAATEQLWNSAKGVFTEKYGKAEVKDKTITWRKDKLIVEMEDKSEGKDFGLFFQFSPTNLATFSTTK